MVAAILLLIPVLWGMSSKASVAALKLDRQEALDDIDALVYGISNVHPDMFSECPQVDFFRAVARLKDSIKDSIGIEELYLGASPIVAMLGDGHTHLLLPEEYVFGDSEMFMPLSVVVGQDNTLHIVWSSDDAIPPGSVIFTVNGITADSIIKSMIPLQSGERDQFKLMRINNDFTGLFKMLYPADEYSVTYRSEGGDTVSEAILSAAPWVKIKSHFSCEDTDPQQQPYSYTIDVARNVAVMDFRAFSDERYMKQFADSMFSELRERKIGNLIIDLRENGGGNSLVGDILLKYISSHPFTQMDRILVRVTPFTARLLNAPNLTPMFQLNEVSPAEYIQPLTTAEGHYDGNVYLLTSSKTFSAAASFAWTFSQCGIGTIIGEETGGMNVCYGDKVWYRLPHSGLECGISFKRFWLLRADESAIHGALPDIPVSAPTALTTALSIIDEQ